MASHPVFLSLGSNVGNRLYYLQRAVQALRQHLMIHHISPVYESGALMKEGAPSHWNKPYINAVLYGDTTLTPHALLRCTQKIEKQLGRTRMPGEVWAPRTLDIDLLFFGKQCMHTKELTLPHPEILHRSFVLKPLTDIMKNWHMPGPTKEKGKTLDSLNRRYSNLWTLPIHKTGYQLR